MNAQITEVLLFLHRRQPSLTGQETTSSSAGTSNGPSDLESLKQEILTEMRQEMNKMKSEIIAGMIIVCHVKYSEINGQSVSLQVF